MTEEFEIKILDLHWLSNIEEEQDRCLHGHIYVKVGDEIVSDFESGDWTLSVTALYLLRSLESDYYKDIYASQMLPCCGHFIYTEKEDADFVIICGCPNGIDWTIKHVDSEVIHITENGKQANISKKEYKKVVLDFADKIEHFYRTSKPKELPTDEFDLRGYNTFWKEWKILRDKYI